jgi:hypothetical protein
MSFRLALAAAGGEYFSDIVVLGESFSSTNATVSENITIRIYTDPDFLPTQASLLYSTEGLAVPYFNLNGAVVTFTNLTIIFNGTNKRAFVLVSGLIYSVIQLSAVFFNVLYFGLLTGGRVMFERVAITNGGGGANQYSFVDGRSSEVIFKTSCVGPLSLSGNSATLVAGGSGVSFMVNDCNFTSFSSSSVAPLIFSDTASNVSQGVTDVSISNSSFTDMTV